MTTKLILALIVVTALGCEREYISACGEACHQSNVRMLSYSGTEGCKCEGAPQSPCSEAKDGGAPRGAVDLPLVP